MLTLVDKKGAVQGSLFLVSEAFNQFLWPSSVGAACVENVVFNQTLVFKNKPQSKLKKYIHI